MTLWLAFALMTAVAIFAVLWPLSRTADAEAGNDIAVYRDQLAEIDRDYTAGRIGDGEAQAARVEVSRRLLAAADAVERSRRLPAVSSTKHRRAIAVCAIVLLPAAATSLYLSLGSPQLPGRPLEERMRTTSQDRSIANLVSQVESHLAKNPADVRGYEVLAPVYLRLGRFADAVNARRKILALKGESAERQSDLGEALVADANGIVTADAKSAFDRALALDPQELKAEFYSGLAAEQDGNRARAASIWRGMTKNAPADAAWLPMVREALARVEGEKSAGSGPNPSADDIAAAGAMNDRDRAEMIRGMVARLADRLKEDGSDVEGWQRLMRAYVVLGEREKANEAAITARRAFANDPDKLHRIEDTITDLGLKG